MTLIRGFDVIRAGFVLLFAIGQMAAAFFPEWFGLEESIPSRSAESRTILTPGGGAFVIWLPLYFGSIVFAVWQATPPRLSDPLVRPIAWLAGASYCANTVWALYLPAVGTDWTSLILLQLILLPGLIAIAILRETGPLPPSRVVAFLPVYGLAGWITVASPAGVSQVALAEGFNPLGLSVVDAALLLLAAWGVLATVLAAFARSFVYACAIVWGAYWIAEVNDRLGNDRVAWSAGAAAALVVVATVAGKRHAK